MCAEPIAEQHQHVVDLESRALMCTCRGCYLLFTAERAELRYRAVPDRYLSFPDFALGPADWDALQIPVGLAFLFHNSVQGRIVAFYPGPAGATESELPLDAWQRIVAANPQLGRLRPDVEALLVRGPDRDAAPATGCYLVPIDACYELVGRLRMLWRGFDGGQEARAAIDEFFAQVAAAQPSGPAAGGVRRERPGRSPCVDVFAEPYAAAPQLTARLRIEESSGRPCTRSRCAARSGSSRSGAPTTRPTRAGCAPCSATGTAGPTRCSRSCGCSAAPWSRASPAVTEVDLAAAVHLRLRRHRVALPARGRRGHRPAACCCSPAPCSPGASTGFGVEQVPWDCEASYRLPVAVWRQMIASYFPSTGWIRLDHDVLGALADYQARHGLTSLGGDRADAARRPGRGRVMSADAGSDGSARSPTRCSTRATCSTPTARAPRKNRSRWQFGVLGPPGAAAASFGEEPAMSLQCLLEAGRRTPRR